LSPTRDDPMKVCGRPPEPARAARGNRGAAVPMPSAATPRRPGESTLDRTLTRAGDGAFVVGADGRLLFWNDAAEKILGYTAREVVGKQCCDVFAGNDDKGNRLCYRGCHVMTLVTMGEPVQSFDMRTWTKARRPLWLNFSVLSVPVEKNGAALTIHLFRDTTATKELLTLVHERLAAALGAGDGPAAHSLTRRELEVLRQMAAGANTKVAADKLGVSPATIRNHAQNMFAKLDVHSRLEAVAYALKHGLL
jgi:PAS domain S-box-containing protein